MPSCVTSRTTWRRTSADRADRTLGAGQCPALLGNHHHRFPIPYGGGKGTTSMVYRFQLRPDSPARWCERNPGHSETFTGRFSMKMLLLIILLVGSASTSNGRSVSPIIAAANIAVTHVTIVDVTGGPARHDQTVLIDGSRIAAVGPTSRVPIPPGSQIIDGTGKYLIPG